MSGTTRKPIEHDKQLGDVQLVQLDVREAESIRSCIQKVIDSGSRIDVLVNNARLYDSGLRKQNGLAAA